MPGTVYNTRASAVTSKDTDSFHPQERHDFSFKIALGSPNEITNWMLISFRHMAYIARISSSRNKAQCQTDQHGTGNIPSFRRATPHALRRCLRRPDGTRVPASFVQFCELDLALVDQLGGSTLRHVKEKRTGNSLSVNCLFQIVRARHIHIENVRV